MAITCCSNAFSESLFAIRRFFRRRRLTRVSFCHSCSLRRSCGAFHTTHLPLNAQAMPSPKPIKTREEMTIIGLDFRHAPTHISHDRVRPPVLALSPSPRSVARTDGRPATVTRVASGSRTLQGHHQRAHGVRRSPRRHRSQSRRDRLDRGAAEKLRLHQHRAHHLQLPATTACASSAGAPAPLATGAVGPQTRFGRRRRTAARHSRRHRRQHRSDETTGREAACAQHAAVDARIAAGGLLHQSRDVASRRDVHRRRAHGRTWLGRSGQRRRIGNGARDGIGARVQQSRCAAPTVRSASRSGTTRKPV